MVLDILVWNGVVLGSLILVYFTLWMIWLNYHSKRIESIVASLMVAAVLIHALLEYPLQYAYFLLPVGFLMGLIQAQTPDQKWYALPRGITRVVWLAGFILLALIWRDYSLYKLNSVRIIKKQPPNVEIWGSAKILVLTEFDQRLDWLKLSPVAQLSLQQLNQIEKMVYNKATPYNMQKYAQLLRQMDRSIRPESRLAI